jgi:hypothetical protein
MASSCLAPDPPQQVGARQIVSTNVCRVGVVSRPRTGWAAQGLLVLWPPQALVQLAQLTFGCFLSALNWDWEHILPSVLEGGLS